MIARAMAIALAAASSLAIAAPWEPGDRLLKGTYQVYGGELGDMTLPTRQDQKVSFMFTGQFARNLYDQIGPNVKDACGASPTHSERQRGDLSCTRDGKAYTCYLGLNIVTGKSMPGAIC